jgi:hypothetical protein
MSLNARPSGAVVIAYLRSRLSIFDPETSTLVGAAIFVAALWAGWHFREQLAGTLTALLGIASMAIPDLTFKSAFCRAALFARAILNSPSCRMQAKPVEQFVMASTTFAALRAEIEADILTKAEALPAPFGPTITALKALKDGTGSITSVAEDLFASFEALQSELASTKAALAVATASAPEAPAAV